LRFCAKVSGELETMTVLADLQTIKDHVIRATRTSAPNVDVADVTLEADRDDEGADFLRVIVQVKPGDEADDDALEALLEVIEEAVEAIDERYPSVRFADAA
jgi:hypothetical protein